MKLFFKCHVDNSSWLKSRGCFEGFMLSNLAFDVMPFESKRDVRMCNEHRGNFTALVQSFISASSCGPFTATHFFRALFLTSQLPKPLMHLTCSVCCCWLTYVCNVAAVVTVNIVIIFKDRFSILPLCGMWRFIVWHISIGQTSCFQDLSTFIIHQTTRRNFPEDRNLHRHRSNNVKPHNPLFSYHISVSDSR